MTAVDMLREFHAACGLPARSAPDFGIDDSERHLRAALLCEESREAREALHNGDLVNAAHELADVVYVCYGTAVQFGINLDVVLAEVHRANMSKIELDGTVLRRADGKVLKGSQFRAADVAAVLRKGAS